jgi:hypothetical protein
MKRYFCLYCWTFHEEDSERYKPHLKYAFYPPPEYKTAPQAREYVRQLSEEALEAAKKIKSLPSGSYIISILDEKLEEIFKRTIRRPKSGVYFKYIPLPEVVELAFKSNDVVIIIKKVPKPEIQLTPQIFATPIVLPVKKPPIREEVKRKVRFTIRVENAIDYLLRLLTKYPELFTDEERKFLLSIEEKEYLTDEEVERVMELRREVKLRIKPPRVPKPKIPKPEYPPPQFPPHEKILEIMNLIDYYGISEELVDAITMIGVPKPQIHTGLIIALYAKGRPAHYIAELLKIKEDYVEYVINQYKK